MLVVDDCSLCPFSSLCILGKKKKWSYNEIKSTISLLNVCMQISSPTLDIQRIWEGVLSLPQGQASGVAGLLASPVTQLM